MSAQQLCPSPETTAAAQLDLDALCPACMQETLADGVCSACGKPVPAQQSPADALPLWSILQGRYLVGRCFFHGGFGITYIALDLRDMHRVTIKEYMPNGVGSRKAGGSSVTQVSPKDFVYGQKHFEQEAEMIFAFRHLPSIFYVEQVFRENGTSYYVIERLTGHDLKFHLDDHGGRISFLEASRLLLPIIRDLSFVHQAGVIHLNISASEIYVCEDGSTRLLGFDSAHNYFEHPTDSYAVCLARGYAPLEQYLPGSLQGPITDIYAMTAVLFRCVSGKLPPEVIKRLNGQDDLPRLVRDLPITPPQRQVLLKGMAIKPEDRYATMRELYDAIVLSLPGDPVAPRSPAAT